VSREQRQRRRGLWLDARSSKEEVQDQHCILGANFGTPQLINKERYTQRLRRKPYLPGALSPPLPALPRAHLASFGGPHAAAAILLWRLPSSGDARVHQAGYANAALHYGEYEADRHQLPLYPLVRLWASTFRKLDLLKWI
jgi:hypothetical protein